MARIPIPACCCKNILRGHRLNTRSVLEQVVLRPEDAMSLRRIWHPQTVSPVAGRKPKHNYGISQDQRLRVMAAPGPLDTALNRRPLSPANKRRHDRMHGDSRQDCSA